MENEDKKLPKKKVHYIIGVALGVVVLVWASGFFNLFGHNSNENTYSHNGHHHGYDHTYSHSHIHEHGNSHDYGHSYHHNHDHHLYEFFIPGENGHINIYSSRHFLADEYVFSQFTQQTGIGINVIMAHGNQVVERLRIQGSTTEADLIIADDGGVLSSAKAQGLIMPITSDILSQNVGEGFKDSDNYWHGLSFRARALAMLQPYQFTTYQDLYSDEASVLLRPGNHLYNVSLLASLIEIYGFDTALQWANDINLNRARSPQGNDRDQMNALVAGIGNVALINSYYVGLMINSHNLQEVLVGENIYIVFPNQYTTGTHINISGMAIPTYSSNVEGALAFMEFITSTEMQTLLANENYEFPVNPNATVHPMFYDMVPFDIQEIDFTSFYQNHIQAIHIMNIVGW